MKSIAVFKLSEVFVTFMIVLSKHQGEEDKFEARDQKLTFGDLRQSIAAVGAEAVQSKQLTILISCVELQSHVSQSCFDLDTLILTYRLYCISILLM